MAEEVHVRKHPVKSTSHTCCAASLAETTLDTLDILSSASFDPASPSSYQSSLTFNPELWDFPHVNLSPTQQRRSASKPDIDPTSKTSMAVTSTPVLLRPKHLHNRLAVPTSGASQAHRGSGCSADSLGVGSCVSLINHDEGERQEGLQAPIIGFEIMEQRAKFTVFKIHVCKSEHESWVIFRRYTDFVRVNTKLKEIFPTFRLALPPKRWFGSNFDPNFLEDRQIGLQTFINNLIGHKDIVLSAPVREFLCLDDPPGPYDNLEESRALCESLDETVYSLRLEVAERNKKIAQLNADLQTAQERIQQLLGNSTDKTENSTPVSGENSTIEGDLHSQTEADQLLSFTQAEVHSIKPSIPDKLVQGARLDETGSQSSMQSAEESGAKQGLIQEDDEVFLGTQPSIIAVT